MEYSKDALEVLNLMQRKDFKNISKMLKKVIDESTNFVSNDVTLEISKCIMRDMSLQKGEDSDIRVLIYQNWLCLGN